MRFGRVQDRSGYAVRLAASFYISRSGERTAWNLWKCIKDMLLGHNLLISSKNMHVHVNTIHLTDKHSYR